MQAPFFYALHASTILICGATTAHSIAAITPCMWNGAIECAVVAPQIKIVEKRAAWWQIFRNRSPLASRAQHIHDPVHHFAHVDVALVATAPGRWDQRLHMRAL